MRARSFLSTPRSAGSSPATNELSARNMLARTMSVERASGTRNDTASLASPAVSPPASGASHATSGRAHCATRDAFAAAASVALCRSLRDRQGAETRWKRDCERHSSTQSAELSAAPPAAAAAAGSGATTGRTQGKALASCHSTAIGDRRTSVAVVRELAVVVVTAGWEAGVGL